MFEPDYKLPSLHELETYVKREKHLPCIASATEVQTNGMDVAATTSALIKQVEQLLLHVIAQDKELKALKAEAKRVVNRNQLQIGDNIWSKFTLYLNDPLVSRNFKLNFTQ